MSKELLVNAPDELITITPPPGFEIEWVKIWILVDDYENEAGEEK
jgi:hypothetical protein